MKDLNPKILSKLSKELGISPRTIQNKISKLASKYPWITPNGRAQMVAQKSNKTVHTFLDQEDSKSLHLTSISSEPTVTKQQALKVLFQKNKETKHWYTNFWIQIISTFMLTGVLAGTIAQVLGIYISLKLGLIN